LSHSLFTNKGDESVNQAQLTKWGERYGLKLDQVRKLQKLIDRFVREEEHATSGDAHYNAVDIHDKNENSRLWSAESDKTGEKLKVLAGKLGFDAVDFASGIIPTFHKGDERYIMVPRR
jgi:hypothetical protein